MQKLAGLLTLLILLSCGNDKEGEQKSGETGAFSKLFKKAAVPFTISDTGLLKLKDTTRIRTMNIGRMIPDRVKSLAFAKTPAPQFFAYRSISASETEQYFIVEGRQRSQKALFLLAFDSGKFKSAIPFLIPDGDPSTTQTASIDRSFSISRSQVKRKGNELIGEGKNVYVYNKAAGEFTLIMTDLLEEKNLPLINPIDTFSKDVRFGGDYLKGKRNIVSIRKGRTPEQALAFIHLENEKGDCIAELKGEIFFTSSKTAVYRAGGDPCVLALDFSTNSVTLREEQGCGNYRGLDCPIQGVYSKKKEPSRKPASSSSKRK